MAHLLYEQMPEKTVKRGKIDTINQSSTLHPCGIFHLEYMRSNMQQNANASIPTRIRSPTFCDLVGSSHSSAWICDISTATISVSRYCLRARRLNILNASVPLHPLSTHSSRASRSGASPHRHCVSMRSHSDHSDTVDVAHVNYKEISALVLGLTEEKEKKHSHLRHMMEALSGSPLCPPQEQAQRRAARSR